MEDKGTPVGRERRAPGAATQKPHIKLSYGLWKCFGLQTYGCGPSPLDAYMDWLKQWKPMLRVA